MVIIFRNEYAVWGGGVLEMGVICSNRCAVKTYRKYILTFRQLEKSHKTVRQKAPDSKRSLPPGKSVTVSRHPWKPHVLQRLWYVKTHCGAVFVLLCRPYLWLVILRTATRSCYCYCNEMHAAGLLRRNGADPSTLHPRLSKERGALCRSHLRFLLNDCREVIL